MKNITLFLKPVLSVFLLASVILTSAADASAGGKIPRKVEMSFTRDYEIPGVPNPDTPYPLPVMEANTNLYVNKEVGLAELEFLLDMGPVTLEFSTISGTLLASVQFWAEPGITIYLYLPFPDILYEVKVYGDGFIGTGYF